MFINNTYVCYLVEQDTPPMQRVVVICFLTPHLPSKYIIRVRVRLKVRLIALTRVRRLNITYLDIEYTWPFFVLVTF